MQEYSGKLSVTAMLRAVSVLEERGLVWHSNFRCQVCGSDRNVYETHRDLIDASRQVNVCAGCLVTTAMRIDDDAF